MVRKFCYILFLGGCIVFPFLIFSCTKEAMDNVELDTVLVARIFQPDPYLSKDAVIESILPDKNFGDSTLFSVFSWTNDGLFNTARSLLAFDLTSIAPQTQIKKASLSLYWISYKNLTEHTGENAFSIYPVSEAWDEHSVTWNNQPDTSSLPKVSVPKSILGNQAYLDIDVTEIVQKMIKDPSTNYGFMFMLDTEFPYKLTILASGDYTDSRRRPKLIVYY